jgi:hypothetical protein
MGLSSDDEKGKNGGKVNLTADLFVSRALKARPLTITNLTDPTQSFTPMFRTLSTRSS